MTLFAMIVKNCLFISLCLTTINLCILTVHEVIMVNWELERLNAITLLLATFEFISYVHVDDL